MEEKEEERMKMVLCLGEDGYLALLSFYRTIREMFESLRRKMLVEQLLLLWSNRKDG